MKPFIAISFHEESFTLAVNEIEPNFPPSHITCDKQNTKHWKLYYSFIPYRHGKGQIEN